MDAPGRGRRCMGGGRAGGYSSEGGRPSRGGRVCPRCGNREHGQLPTWRGAALPPLLAGSARRRGARLATGLFTPRASSGDGPSVGRAASGRPGQPGGLPGSRGWALAVSPADNRPPRHCHPSGGHAGGSAAVAGRGAPASAAAAAMPLRRRRCRGGPSLPGALRGPRGAGNAAPPPHFAPGGGCHEAGARVGGGAGRGRAGRVRLGGPPRYSGRRRGHGGGDVRGRLCGVPLCPAGSVAGADDASRAGCGGRPVGRESAPIRGYASFWTAAARVHSSRMGAVRPRGPRHCAVAEEGAGGAGSGGNAHGLADGRVRGAVAVARAGHSRWLCPLLWGGRRVCGDGSEGGGSG